MATDTRRRPSEPHGEPRYWLVATNRDTEHWICWPERDMLSSAIEDARRAVREVDAIEFRTLLGDDEVTFFVDRCYPHQPDTEAFVWSWTWGKPWPVGFDAPTPA